MIEQDELRAVHFHCCCVTLTRRFLQQGRTTLGDFAIDPPESGQTILGAIVLRVTHLANATIKAQTRPQQQEGVAVFEFEPPARTAREVFKRHKAFLPRFRFSGGYVFLFNLFPSEKVCVCRMAGFVPRSYDIPLTTRDATQGSQFTIF